MDDDPGFGNPLFGSAPSPPRPGVPGYNAAWSPTPGPQSHPVRRFLESAANMDEDLADEGTLVAMEDPSLQLESVPTHLMARASRAPSYPLAPPSPAPSLAPSSPEASACARVLEHLVSGRLSPAQATLSHASVLLGRASALRAWAGAPAQRLARSEALRRRAAGLEAEAETWLLLWFLHGEPDRQFPGGTGGDFVAGAGMAKTFAHRAADAVFQDGVLHRAARAVAWLEFLAMLRGGRAAAWDGGDASGEGEKGQGFLSQAALRWFGAGVDGGVGIAEEDAEEAAGIAASDASAEEIYRLRLDPRDAQSATRALLESLEAPLGAADCLWRATRARLEASDSRGATGRRGAASLAAAKGYVTSLDPDAPSRERARLDAEDERAEGWVSLALLRAIRCGRADVAGALGSRAGAPWKSAALGGAGALGPLPLGAAASLASEEEQAEEGLGMDLHQSGLDSPPTPNPWAAAEFTAESLAEEVELGAGSRRALWRFACHAASARAARQSLRSEAAAWGALGGNLAALLPACTGWEGALWAHLRCWLDAAVDFQLGAEPDAGAEQERGALEAARELVEDAESWEACVGGATLAMAGGWPFPGVRRALPASYAECVETALASAPAQAALHAAPGGIGEAEGFETATPCAVALHRALQRALLLDDAPEAVEKLLAPWALAAAQALDAEGADGEESWTVPTPPDPASPTAARADAVRFAAHLAPLLWELRAVPAPRSAHEAYSPAQDALHRVLGAAASRAVRAGDDGLVPLLALYARPALRRAAYASFLQALAARADPAAQAAAYLAASARFGPGGVSRASARHAAACAREAAEDELGALVDGAWARARASAEPGGPRWRAAQAGWLALDAAARGRPGALRALAELFRELALGGVRGARAAAALCEEVLPPLLGGEPEAWALACARDEDATAAARALAAELHVWAVHARLDAAFVAWHGAYARHLQAEEEEDGGESGGRAALVEAARELLRGQLAFLREGWLRRLAGEEGAQQAALVLGPEGGEEGGGAGYSRFKAEEALQAAVRAVQLPSAASLGLRWVPGPAPPGFPSCLALAVQAAGPAETEVAALALARALRGAAPWPGGEGGAGGAGLAAAALDASLALGARVCEAVCAARVALRCGALREALAYLGHPVDEGAEIMELAAGPLSSLCTPGEMAELLQYERGTRVLLLRLREREGRD